MQVTIKEQLIHNLNDIDFSNIFIIDSIDNRRISYSSFFYAVKSISEQLKKYRGKRIILLMQNSIELCLLYFACVRLNAIAVPIDPNKGLNEILTIIEDNEQAMIISDQKYEHIEEDFLTKDLSFNFIDNSMEIEKIKTYTISVFNKADFDKLFLISYTSGTSGIPKGVMHSLSNLFTSSSSFGDKFEFNNTSIFCHIMPMTYMAGILNTIFMPFFWGCKIAIMKRFSIDIAINFWDLAEKCKANTFWLSPTMLEMIYKLDRGNTGVKYLETINPVFCIGTAPLNTSTKDRFEARYKVNLFQSYGLSETLFVSTNHKKCVSSNAVGEILSGVEINLDIDEEIQISVPWMFLGYTNEDTNIYFKNNFYLTGDLGELSSKNILQVTGRKKDLIIKGGMNISPRLIENFIIDMDIIENPVVFSSINKKSEEMIICAYIGCKIANQKEIKREINQKIQKMLGEFYKIDALFSISEIPKNINGKVDKKTIKSLYEEQNDIKI